MEATYKKSKGNAGLEGVQFQLNLLTVFLLNALHDRKNWKISTENQEAGKYDDLVLELPDKSILLQAKFKQNKKINRDQLFSCNSKNTDFSLPKYFFSYLEVRSEAIEKTVIICTNTDIDEKGLENFLTRHCVGSDSMLHYENATCPFFTFNENIVSDLKASAEIYLDKNLQGKGFNITAITDENIKNFLKNLQLFSNYPSRDKLDKVIEQLLSRLNNISLYQKVTSQEIYKKIEDWFKQPKGEYLTEERARAMFSEIKSDQYCEELKNYNVSFSYLNFNITDSIRIYHISSERGHLLQALKIYHALEKYETKKLYVNPDDTVEVQKCVIEAFKLSRYAFLIIIGSKAIEETEVLRDILLKSNNKIIILVDESNDKFSKEIGLNDIVYVDGHVTFNDLSDDCQKKLIKGKNIIFQEEIFSLEELLAPQTSENWASAINSEILENIVRKKEIKVGLRPISLSKHDFRCYIYRTFKTHMLKNEDEQGNDELINEKFQTINLLGNSISKVTEKIFSEEDIYYVDEKVVLISASAGLGKSTVLTKLAMSIKEKNPHLWVLKIELNEYTDILRHLLKNGMESISVEELLNSRKATKFTNHLEKFVFSMNKKVVLMLDGIDEISPDYTRLILSLLKQCRQASNFAKLFVTTRPHMISELEGLFKMKPFMLQPFTEQNQVDFLTSYWGHHLDINNDKAVNCKQYAKALISRMSLWIKSYGHYKEHDFTSIPLQLRMLAEIFQESIKLNETDWEGCKEYLEETRMIPKLPKKIEIKKLYDMFIEKKKDVYIDKENPSGKSAVNSALIKQFDDSLTFLRTFALEVILHKEDCQLFSYYGQRYHDMDETSLKIGILQKSNGEFHFIHRTFAEYFVAESLVDLLQLQLREPNVNFQRFFIEQILISPNYRIIRAFLDNFLLDIINSIPCNIFKKYQSQSFYFFSEDRTRLIHLLAREGCVTILQLILKCVKFKIITHKEININDLYNNSSMIKENIFKHLARKMLISIKHDEGNVLNIVQVLVQKGGINIKNEFGWSPLFEAARSGHFETVRFLVEQGAKIDSVDNYGNTALHSAAVICQTNIVKYLVDLGVNVNFKNNKGRTSLHFSAAKGDSDSVKYLITSSANVNDKDNNGLTALHFAAANGRLNIVSLLVELGADFNIADKEGRTALHLAVVQRQLMITEYLVKCTNVNIKDEKGRTALYLAAACGHLEIIKLLFECGADLNIRDNHGRTALHIAVVSGQLDTVRLLFEQGAAFAVGDNDGRMALHFASGCDRLDIVKFLSEQGVDFNAGDSDGNTALHLVAANGQLDTVKFLHRMDADLNIGNNNGRTALHVAAMKGHLGVVKYLLKFSNAVNIKDFDGRTALHLATAYNQMDTVKFLLQQNADCNIGDNIGRTALHLAVVNGYLNLVQLLFELGAAVDIVDTDGHTAPLLAVDMAHFHIASYFENQSKKKG